VSLIANLVDVVRTRGGTKGILINAKEHYVDVKAKTAVGFASKGPTVIESSKYLIADLIKAMGYDNNIPLEFLKKEIDGTAPSSFENAEAVILRSVLVRALADEVIMAAKDNIVLKAVNCIHIIVGENGGVIPTVLTVGLPNPNLNLKLTALADAKTKVKSEEFAKGILFQTNAASSPVKFVTIQETSGIDIVQGSSKPATRSLKLAKDVATLKADADLVLDLQGDANSPTAKLSVSGSCFLNLTGTDAVFQQAGGSSLEIKSDGTTLNHATKITIKVGAGTGELSTENLNLEALTLGVMAPQINLG
jgi:hypothetical protein